MRKYSLNENFFNIIDSEEKAYFLGLIYADGYINEKINLIDITLHQQDVEILDKFVSYLYPNGRPLKKIRNNYVRLNINSKKIVNDLKYHGCFQKKTFLIKFPITISDNLIRDFIRGYFDGDGSVYKNKDTLMISIVGTIELLDGINEKLKFNCNLNNTIYDNRHPNRNNNIRALRFGGNIIINRIYHYMYDDATIYLTRKKNKFLDILKEKKYFCNKQYSRNTFDKYIEYDGKKYTKTELSKKLSQLTGISSVTIRKKLYNKWTINEIINNPLNLWRKKKNDS